MSANINFNQQANQYAFYARKDIAWHNLGQIVQEAKTSDDVIKLAHLDWNVAKMPKYIQYPLDSNYLDDKGIRKRGILSPNDKALVRLDTGQQLGNCTDKYEIIQNIDAFNFIDNIVGEKLAIYETAGALGNGETIFVTAKLPSYIKPTNNDKDIIEQYILFTSGHDGNTAIRVMFTPIRVVCNNTLNMALRQNTGKITIRHTKSAQDRIKNARQIMNLYTDYSIKLTYDLARMAEFDVNDRIIDKVLANTFLTSEQIALFDDSKILLRNDLPSKTRNQLVYAKDYIDLGPGQDYNRGTAYWLYNGITSYLSNGKDFNNQEDRFKALIDGNEYKIAQKAYNTINDLILV
jgi:phage/plasmid-like protein (TIGR03299 family)